MFVGTCIKFISCSSIQSWRVFLLQMTNLLQESFLGLLITTDQLLHHHHLSCGFMSHLLVG